ncbi:MAG: hypothetical protein KatS3mg015_2796 [Fimbriimonadales bacterium]|nr:MAG: hypothetical protein KatS3mg015_2796 [Fimbriimonadales bacterium]
MVWRSKDMAPSVYVGGTFDLFHAGHVELLRRAAQHGRVWVALNSDHYAESLKGRKPVLDYGERAAVLLACEYVTSVLCNNGTERDLLEIVQPSTIIYANDGTYSRDSYLSLLGIDEDWLKRNSAELKFLPYTEGVSSTEIINRIIQRYCGEPRQ